MAKVTSFVYCLNASRMITADGKGEMINAEGVLSTITPEYVPGSFSFSIIFSIIDFDIKENNKIRIVFSDAENKEIVNSNDISLPIQIVEDQIDIPEKYKGINLSMDMRNVVLEKDGVYKTTIYFNGESIGSYEIYIKGKNRK